jgi:hypothetical protein
MKKGGEIMKKDQMWRLTADEGKILTDGKGMFYCVHVSPEDDPDRYTEIDDPNKEVNENER